MLKTILLTLLSSFVANCRSSHNNIIEITPMDPATQMHKNLFVMYGLTFCRKGAPRPFVWGRGEGEEEEGIVAPLGE